MRLLVIEPLSRAHQHSQFNRDYLETLGSLGAEIDFVASACHLDAVLNGPGKLPNVRSVPAEFSLGRGWTKIVRNAVLFRQIIGSRSDKSRRVFVLACNNSLLAALKLAMIGINAQLAVILHGFIADLGCDRGSRAFQLVRFSLCWGNRSGRYTYIVISEHIRESLTGVLPSLDRYVKTLPFPISPAGAGTAAGAFQRVPIRFGAAGVFSVSKGTHHLFDVAQACAGVPNFSFHYIGSIPNDWRSRFKSPGANCALVEDPDDEAFAAEFRSLDFVLFFYPRGTYRFGLSGVLLMAIRYAKPLIVIRNPMFEYFFQKYGQLGWLFETPADMACFIKAIPAKVSLTELQAIADNYRTLQAAFSTSSLAPIFKELLNA